MFRGNWRSLTQAPPPAWHPYSGGGEEGVPHPNMGTLIMQETVLQRFGEGRTRRNTFPTIPRSSKDNEKDGHVDY